MRTTPKKLTSIRLRCDETFRRRLHQLSLKRQKAISKIIRDMVEREYLQEFTKY